MRSEVMWFANQMEKKLNQRMAHKTGWYNTNSKVLLKRLMDEVEELLEALQETYKVHRLENIRKAYSEVIKESVDVANFAMMIADKANRVLG